MLYYVYKLSMGEKELLSTCENISEATKCADEMRKKIRIGNNKDGVFADISIISEEEQKRIKKADERWRQRYARKLHETI